MRALPSATPKLLTLHCTSHMHCASVVPPREPPQLLAQLVASYFGVPVGPGDMLRPVTHTLWRWRTGADAQGWLPCTGRCGWGTQRRVVDGREQTRRCFAAGFTNAAGECITAER
jgi:hypothetical protein